MSGEVGPVFFRAPPGDDSDEDGLLSAFAKVGSFPELFCFGISMNVNGIVWSTQKSAMSAELIDTALLDDYQSREI